MAIKFSERTEDDYIIYSNNGKRLRIYYPDILQVAFVARDWHGGQGSSLYALSSSGTADPKHLKRALSEFHSIEPNDTGLTDEEYEDYLSAVETLERIVAKIEALEDE